MTLRCRGCGQFISKDSAYAQGPSCYVSHMKEKCLNKMFARVKKSTPGLNFFEKNAVNTESMQEIISLWGMQNSTTDIMPTDEIVYDGIED